MRQLVSEFGLNRHALLLHLTFHQLEDIANEIVDINRNDLLVVFLEHRSDGVEYVACALTLPDDAFES